MYELIQHQKLESGTSSITFSNIPQNYTDLKLVLCLRSEYASVITDGKITFNGQNSNKSGKLLWGQGSGGGNSGNYSDLFMWFPGTQAPSGTFSTVEVYIPNYTSSNQKITAQDIVIENNAAFHYAMFFAGLWASTAAINSISLNDTNGANFSIGSTATLYGVARKTFLGRPSQPKATGGAITFANGYWVHTFTGSGTFVPNQNLATEYLIIAGGGGTTFGLGGGGGAGGYRCSVQGEMSGGGATAESPALLLANTSYPVVVGAGGPGEKLSNQAYGGQGSDSSFAGITSLGGGRGVGQSINYPSNPPGQLGGSGSGGVRNNNNPGAGTTGQGYSGGFGSNNANGYGGGGGGGAGGAGANGGSANGGNGGIGVTSSITGTAVARAGGGGGCVGEGTFGVGVAGGGNGGGDLPAAVATDGAPNTGGGGGGGDDSNGRAGGSGVVIIRYRAD